MIHNAPNLLLRTSCVDSYSFRSHPQQHSYSCLVFSATERLAVGGAACDGLVDDHAIRARAIIGSTTIDVHYDSDGIPSPPIGLRRSLYIGY